MVRFASIASFKSQCANQTLAAALLLKLAARCSRCNTNNHLHHKNTNPDSAQSQHQTSYFRVTSRLQYLTKIRETCAKTSYVSLSNHSNNNHLFRSYTERVLTTLVKPCPKTRNKIPAEITKLRRRFPNSFQIRILQSLCPNCRELNEESKTSTITQIWVTHQKIRAKYHIYVLTNFQ